jgi:hypothetical protein
MHDVALSYLDFGWSIIPLEPHNKRPYAALLPIKHDGHGNVVYNEHGRPKHTWEPYQTRQPTLDEVRQWWAQAPDANIGIVTGAVSGIVVQDLDGPEGMAEAQRRGGIPTTPISRTGNGLHVLYRHPGREVGNFARRAPGIDMRGDGGYIVAPPSIHPNGHQYQWQVTPDVPLAEAPEWFVELWTPDSTETWITHTLTGEIRRGEQVTSRNYGDRALATELQRLATAAEGSRNNTLVRAAYRMGQLVAGGHVGEETVEHKLALVAQAIGLTQGETRATIRSGLKAGMLNPRR